MQTTSEIQNLYEDEYKDLLGDYPSLINGFREHADRIEHVMRVVKNLAPKSMLDVGCREGLFGALCNWSHQPLERLVGLDIVPEMTRYAFFKHGYHKTLVKNVAEPFDLGERFDVVLCMEVLEHVPDVRQVIDNCLTHSNKHVIFSTPEEEGEVDGKIHVRHINLDLLTDLVTNATGGSSWRIYQAFVPSLFCEKPRWKGWNFVRAERV